MGSARTWQKGFSLVMLVVLFFSSASPILARPIDPEALRWAELLNRYDGMIPPQMLIDYALRKGGYELPGPLPAAPSASLFEPEVRLGDPMEGGAPTWPDSGLPRNTLSLAYSSGDEVALLQAQLRRMGTGKQTGIAPRTAATLESPPYSDRVPSAPSSMRVLGAALAAQLLDPPQSFSPVSEVNHVYLPLVLVNYSNAMITSRGGVYHSPDGLVTVSFPAGAVTETITVAYTPTFEARQSPYPLPSMFAIAGSTRGGERAVLAKPITIEVQQPAGRPLQLYTLDGSSLRWVAVGTHSASAGPGQVVATAGVRDLGMYVVLPMGDENPDEGDDGLVIIRNCWKPQPEDWHYTVMKTDLYTTTKESFPLAFMWTCPADVEDPDHDFYLPAEWDFTHEPEVTITLAPAGPYTMSAVYSYTIFALDFYSGTIRYDFDEGTFQVGTEGCVDGGGGCEHFAPTVDYVDIWQDGVDRAIVTVAASDKGSGLASVELIFNGQEVPMTRIGGGSYMAAVTYPKSGSNSYSVVVTDLCGNYTAFPGNDPIVAQGSWSQYYGFLAFKPCREGGCLPGYQGGVGDPVSSYTGNLVYSSSDAFLPGPGDSDLYMERPYNSLASRWPSAAVMRYTDDGSGGANEEIVVGPPQYFGPGWTFPYGTYLLMVDKPPFFQGIQVHYADGRTALFTDNGDGTYSPTAPRTYDTLVHQGDGYILTHTYTLQVERYDATGRLVAVEDRNANAVRLSYDDDRLVRLENDGGRGMEFVYNGAGLITAINLPENVTLRYEYENGLLAAFTDARGQCIQYHYNADGQLTGVITPKGHPALQVKYDPHDARVIEQTVGAAERHAFVYSDDGLTTSMTDAYGRKTVHRYNSLGQLVQVDYADDTSEYYGYDHDFNRTYRRDQLGREWFWTFEDRGNMLTEDGPLDWHREWRYNGLGLPTYMKDSLEREWWWDYDARGNLVLTTNPRNDTSAVVYDERGQPVLVRDFNDHGTHNTFDERGDLVAVADPLDHKMFFTFDGLGRLRGYTDRNGNPYVYGYYGGSYLLTDTWGPSGYHVHNEYDPNGNLALTVDPNGGRMHYEYDASENLCRVYNELDSYTTYTYNDMNVLVQVEDAEGRITTFDHDELYRVAAIHAPEDTHTFLTYDAVGKLLTTTDPEGRVTKLEYDDLDRLTARIQNYVEGAPPDAQTNVTTRYEYYGPSGNLQVLTDANGNPTWYEYDKLDRPIWVENAEHEVTSFEYDDMDNLTRIIRPGDAITDFTYDDADRLVTMRDAEGNLWQYRHDPNDNLTDVIDPYGVVTHYQFNELDRMVAAVRNYVPMGPVDAQTNVTTRFEHDLAGNLRFVTDPRGNKTEYRYDAAHRLERVADTLEEKTVFAYDKVDNLRSVIDASGHTNSYTYDGLNRRTSWTDPEGYFEAYEYDKVGNRRFLTNRRGFTTQWVYDPLNRLAHIIDARDGEVKILYDAMGNVLERMDQNGHPITYTYDRVYRLLTRKDAENYTWTWEYDDRGNPHTVTDPDGHPITYDFNRLDQVVAVTNPEGETTQFEVDALSNRRAQIDPDRIVTRYHYDPLYRLNGVTLNERLGEPSSYDVNVTYRYASDAADNLVAITDPNTHTWTFTYDRLNRLESETDPESNTWSYEYDKVGNLSRRTDANGAVTTYAYYDDDMLRLVTYDDGSAVSFGYDENNNRTVMADGLGASAWTYDKLDRLTVATDALGRTLRYAYDPASNRTSQTSPDGNTVHYTYYHNDWLKTVTDPKGGVTTYERNGTGQATRVLRPNGTYSTMTYDRVDRLLTVENWQEGHGDHLISAYAYEYNNDVGLRDRVTMRLGWRQPDTVVEEYSYDPLRRLVDVHNDEGYAATYVYDAAGNRLSWWANDDRATGDPKDGFTTTYNYDRANRLRGAFVDSVKPNGDRSYTFSYDHNGNRVKAEWDGPPGTPVQGVDYFYDYENRLVEAQDYQRGGGNRVDRAVTTMAYDGIGRRLVKTYDPKTSPDALGGLKRSEYAFDGLDAVGEYSMWNGQRINYYRGDRGGLLSLQHFRSSTGEGLVYYYHQDGLGSTSGLTKHQGQSTHNYRYDVYGVVYPDNGNFTEPHNSFTFTGQQWDEETGLLHFYARDYDPVMGVWMQQDLYRGQLAAPKTLLRYAYVGANPVNLIDLFGYDGGSSENPTKPGDVYFDPSDLESGAVLDSDAFWVYPSFGEGAAMFDPTRISLEALSIQSTGSPNASARPDYFDLTTFPHESIGILYLGDSISDHAAPSYFTPVEGASQMLNGIGSELGAWGRALNQPTVYVSAHTRSAGSVAVNAYWRRAPGDAAKAASFSSAAKYVQGVGWVVTAYSFGSDVYSGYKTDGNQFGYEAKRAFTRQSYSTAFGWGGAAVGVEVCSPAFLGGPPAWWIPPVCGLVAGFACGVGGYYLGDDIYTSWAEKPHGAPAYPLQFLKLGSLDHLQHTPGGYEGALKLSPGDFNNMTVNYIPEGGMIGVPYLLNLDTPALRIDYEPPSLYYYPY